MTAVLLVALVLLPALGAAIAAASSKRPDVAAAAGTMSACVTSVLALGLLFLTRPWTSGADTATVDVGWIGLLGSRLHLGWDGISAPLVVLTSLLATGSCWYVWAGSDDARAGDTAQRPPSPGLLACLLVTQAGAIATFLARDLIVFFIAFETVLVPMWVLIQRWGGEVDAASTTANEARKRSAATRFVLYTALGSAIMLLGLIWLAVAADSTDFDLLAHRAPQLAPSTQAAIAALLIVGLGVKVPIWPLHSWLPPAHTIAPTVGSVLLAGVLLKLGSYGLVRLVAGFVPDGLARLAVPLGVLGVVGIIWGGLVCLVERDLKRLIAFSSVAHMGFVVLGVATGTPEGLQGALFVGVAHGVITGLLFWVVGMIKHRHLGRRPGDAADLTALPAGLRDSHPRLAWLLALGCIASSGLPGLAGFWGEILAILGAWGSPSLGSVGPPLAIAAIAGTVLAAAYLFRVLYLLWHGASPTGEGAASAPAQSEPAGDRDLSVPDLIPRDATTRDATAAVPTTRDATAAALPTREVTVTDQSVPGVTARDPQARDLTSVEWAVCAPLAAATLAFGVQPWLLLSLTGPAVRALVSGS